MFDLAVVDLIMTGIGGLTVLGVTQIIKQFLKASGAGSIVISLVVSAGFTAYFLVTTAAFAVVPFVGYTLLVFATANGIFRATHKTS